MSDDLIRRSDVYKAIDDWLAGRVPNLNIKDIPSADRPQGEWIPCSERLPKENTEVLMSLEWGVDIGEYRNGEWHSEWINHYDDGNVLAWMPLPKPWKGADDE